MLPSYPPGPQGPQGPPGPPNNGYPQQGPPGQHYYPPGHPMMGQQGPPLNQMPMNPQNMQQNGMYGPPVSLPGAPQGGPVPAPNPHMMQWMNSEYPSYSNSPAPSYAPSMMSHMSHASMQDDRHSSMSIQSDMRMMNNDGRPSSQISCSENVDPRIAKPIMSLPELITNFENPAFRPDVIRSLDIFSKEVKAKRATCPTAKMIPLLNRALNGWSVTDIDKMSRSIVYIVRSIPPQELELVIKTQCSDFLINIAKNLDNTSELTLALYELLRSRREDIVSKARKDQVLVPLLRRLMTLTSRPDQIHHYRYVLQCLSVLMREKASKVKQFVMEWCLNEQDKAVPRGLVDIIFKIILPTVQALPNQCQSLPATRKEPISVCAEILHETLELLVHLLAITDLDKAKIVAVQILENNWLLKLLECLIWYPKMEEEKMPIPVKILHSLTYVVCNTALVSEMNEVVSFNVLKMTLLLLKRWTYQRGPDPNHREIFMTHWRYLLGFLYQFTFRNTGNKQLLIQQDGYGFLAYAITRCSAGIDDLFVRLRNLPKDGSIEAKKLKHLYYQEKINLSEALDNAAVTILGLLIVKPSEQLIAKRDQALADSHFVEALLKIYAGGEVIKPEAIQRILKLMVKLIEVVPAYQSEQFLLAPLTLNQTTFTLLPIVMYETFRPIPELFNPKAVENPGKRMAELVEGMQRNLRCLSGLVQFGSPQIKEQIIHFIRASNYHSCFMKLIEMGQSNIEFCRELLAFCNELCTVDSSLGQPWTGDIELLTNNTDAMLARYARQIWDTIGPYGGEMNPMANIGEYM